MSAAALVLESGVEVVVLGDTDAAAGDAGSDENVAKAAREEAV